MSLYSLQNKQATYAAPYFQFSLLVLSWKAPQSMTYTKTHTTSIDLHVSLIIGTSLRTDLALLEVSRLRIRPSCQDPNGQAEGNERLYN